MVQDKVSNTSKLLHWIWRHTEYGHDISEELVCVIFVKRAGQELEVNNIIFIQVLLREGLEKVMSNELNVWHEPFGIWKLLFRVIETP